MQGRNTVIFWPQQTLSHPSKYITTRSRSRTTDTLHLPQSHSQVLNNDIQILNGSSSLLSFAVNASTLKLRVNNSLWRVITSPWRWFSSRTWQAAPTWLQRMLLPLQNNDIKIQHKPGKDMLLADGLSRLPSRSSTHIKLDILSNFV